MFSHIHIYLVYISNFTDLNFQNPRQFIEPSLSLISGENRYSNGLGNVVALCRKKDQIPDHRPAPRPRSMCFFAPTKISDPIGSSFRSNAFDKTLTSRCSSGEKNDEVEGGEEGGMNFRRRYWYSEMQTFIPEAPERSPREHIQ